MRCFFSLALFICSLSTASAARDFIFQIIVGNENVASNVCTSVELEDLSSRMIPTILSVMADPKYDLKPTKESDWKISKSQSAPNNNRKERELVVCPCGVNGAYICSGYGYTCRRRLRSGRELSDIEVLEIKSNTEGAMRGLLNKFANTSPYSKDCTKALIGATIGSTLEIL